MISSFDTSQTGNQVIRLQFVREAALSSDLIAWFSHGGGFSHVDAVGPRGELWGARSDLVGTIPSGVQIRPADYHTFVHRVIFTLQVSPDQRKAFWRFLYAQVGKPYDSKAIWAFAFDRDWRATDSWICSELQMAALEAAGIVPALYVPTVKITPRDVALVISAIGAKVLPEMTWQTESAGQKPIAYAPKNCAA
jgi:hypothetical protein